MTCSYCQKRRITDPYVHLNNNIIHLKQKKHIKDPKKEIIALSSLSLLFNDVFQKLMFERSIIILYRLVILISRFINENAIF